MSKYVSVFHGEAVIHEDEDELIEALKDCRDRGSIDDVIVYTLGERVDIEAPSETWVIGGKTYE